MKNFDYQGLIKRLIFISFVLVLVNIAYADTAFAADLTTPTLPILLILIKLMT